MSDDGSGGAVVGRHSAPDPAPQPPKGGRMPSGFTSFRDLLSFLAGVAILCNEVFVQKRVEIAFLTVGVTLTGLPIVLGSDEKKTGGQR